MTSVAFPYGTNGTKPQEDNGQRPCCLQKYLSKLIVTADGLGVIEYCRFNIIILAPTVILTNKNIINHARTPSPIQNCNIRLSDLPPNHLLNEGVSS